ncbi:MAG TPA: acyltransferase [Drouetiella sp.]
MQQPIVQEQPLPPQKVWWTELDGLRALAFFLVFYSHTTGLFFRQSPGRSPGLMFLSELDQRLLQWGWIGVDLFFVMSAFLITSLLLSERKRCGSVSLKNFLTRRVLRIWPLYFTFLAVAFLAIAPGIKWLQVQAGIPLSAEQLQDASSFWGAFFVFLGNYAIMFQGELVGVINPLWSLCIEEQFYLVWGTIMSKFKEPRHIVAILCAALLVGIAVRASMFSFFSQNYFAIYMNGPARMDSILGGCLAAFFWQSRGEWLRNNAAAQYALFAVTAVSFCSILALAPRLETCDISLIWVFSAIAVCWTSLLLATLSFKPVQSFFRSPLLVHIGKLTYGMYVFHVTCIISSIMFCRLVLHIQSRASFVEACWLMGLPLTYLMARLSWRFLENPFLRLKEKYNQPTKVEQRELAPTS